METLPHTCNTAQVVIMTTAISKTWCHWCT